MNSLGATVITADQECGNHTVRLSVSTKVDKGMKRNILGEVKNIINTLPPQPSQQIASPESLRKHYIKCAHGEIGYDVIEYYHEPVTGFALIILGLYPIANDEPGKIGHTEKQMNGMINHDFFKLDLV